jgi:hypothetical protein
MSQTGRTATVHYTGAQRRLSSERRASGLSVTSAPSQLSDRHRRARDGLRAQSARLGRQTAIPPRGTKYRAHPPHPAALLPARIPRARRARRGSPAAPRRRAPRLLAGKDVEGRAFGSRPNGVAPVVRHPLSQPREVPGCHATWPLASRHHSSTSAHGIHRPNETAGPEPEPSTASPRLSGAQPGNSGRPGTRRRSRRVRAARVRSGTPPPAPAVPRTPPRP